MDEEVYPGWTLRDRLELLAVLSMGLVLSLAESRLRAIPCSRYGERGVLARITVGISPQGRS